jgi:hypothetical protein
MITYVYHCSANNQTVEVQHGMKEQLRTWGDLCARSGQPVGQTDVGAPVERLISGGLHASVAGGTQSSASLLPMAGCCGNPSGCSRHG